MTLKQSIHALRDGDTRRVWAHVARVAAIAAAANLVAPIGCNEAASPDEDVGETRESLGETTCASAAPDAIVANDGSPYDTPQTYSNRRCYKAAVVEIDDWPEDADLAILGDRIPQSAQASQTACEALSMSVFVYYKGAGPPQTFHRTAHGSWSRIALAGTSGFTPACFPPAIFVGGRTWRNFDIDTFRTGSTYVAAASYRTSDASSASTMSMTFKVVRPRCGLEGLPCCGVQPVPDPDFVTGPWCEVPTACIGGITGSCVRCGVLGKPACPHSTCVWGPNFCFGGTGVTCHDGLSTPSWPPGAPYAQCVACGYHGGPCCPGSDMCGIGSDLACQEPNGIIYRGSLPPKGSTCTPIPAPTN